MRAFLLAGLLLVFGLAPAVAGNPTLTLSTNNTPLDRKALEQLSQESLRRIGVDLKLVSLPSERSLTAANLGESTVDEGPRNCHHASPTPNPAFNHGPFDSRLFDVSDC